jgi:hypothetical protein
VPSCQFLLAELDLMLAPTEYRKEPPSLALSYFNTIPVTATWFPSVCAFDAKLAFAEVG